MEKQLIESVNKCLGFTITESIQTTDLDIKPFKLKLSKDNSEYRKAKVFKLTLDGDTIASYEYVGDSMTGILANESTLKGVGTFVYLLSMAKLGGSIESVGGEYKKMSDFVKMEKQLISKNIIKQVRDGVDELGDPIEVNSFACSKVELQSYLTSIINLNNLK